MKKLAFFGVLVLALLLPALAQEAIPKEDASDLYCVNVVIQKVLPYSKGYVVIYRNGSNKLGTVYVPREWFSFATHKAELHQLDYGQVRPSMSVFYKAGEFHLVKLYVSKYNADQTWGTVGTGVNLDAQFEGVDTLTINY